MMNLLERILRMPRAVMTVMALLLIAGFGSYQSLPKESFPAIDIPTSMFGEPDWRVAR